MALSAALGAAQGVPAPDVVAHVDVAFRGSSWCALQHAPRSRRLPAPAELAAKPIVLLGSHLQPCLDPAQRLPVAQVPGHAGQQRGMRNLVAMVGRIRVQHLPLAGVQQPMHMLACVQRAESRNALYMAALTAIRRNPPLAAFYKGLRDRGKQPKLWPSSPSCAISSPSPTPSSARTTSGRPPRPAHRCPHEPPPFQPFMEITLDFRHGCSSLVGSNSLGQAHLSLQRLRVASDRI